jgi:hypothetical protein
MAKRGIMLVAQSAGAEMVQRGEPDLAVPVENRP